MKAYIKRREKDIYRYHRVIPYKREDDYIAPWSQPYMDTYFKDNLLYYDIGYGDRINHQFK